MKTFRRFAVLALVLMVAPVLASAVNTLTQWPNVCIPGGTNAQFNFAPQSGAYASAIPPGLYNCISSNVAAIFMGGGANRVILLSDFTNTTATAATVISYPLLAKTNYTFSCTLYWQNDGTNAPTFTLVTPTTPTSTLAFAQVIYNAAGSQVAGVLSGSPLAYTSAQAAGVGATTYKAIIDGGIQNGSTAGSLSFQASAATGTTTVKASSYCTVSSAP